MNRLSFKKGVSIYGLQPEMLWAIDRCVEIWPTSEITVTSARGDSHSFTSLHYLGMAIDLRTWGIDDVHSLVQHIQDAIGKDYDVIDEGNHIHIEYQPKGKVEYPK